MDWLRYYHNTPYDTKLGMIAKKAGARRCEMTAIWDCLLDYASQHDCRGCIDGIDLELISYAQEIELETVKSVIRELENKFVVVDGFLHNWNQRQIERERSDPNAAERKRKQREKEKTNAALPPLNHYGEKPCHAMSHRDTPPDTDTDTELDKSNSSVTACAETEKITDLPENEPENCSKASKSTTSNHSSHENYNPKPEQGGRASAEEKTSQLPENQPKTADSGSMASDDKPSKPATYPPDFERFWNAYPSGRRKEKPNALKAWRQAIKLATLEEIMAGVQSYATSREVLEGFSCYPAKWLKNQRWIEDYSIKAQGNPHARPHQQPQPCQPNGEQQTAGGYRQYPNKPSNFEIMQAGVARAGASFAARHEARRRALESDGSVGG